MKKKRNTISVPLFKPKNLVHVLVTILCFVGVNAALYLFWKSLNRTMTKQHEQPIGYITFKHKIAQRRFGDRTAWDILKNNSPIYNQDVLHTADLSDVIITFLSGDRLELAENSLVQIYADANGKRLELSGGNINMQAAETGTNRWTLVSGGNKVTVGSGAMISAGIGAETGFNVQVVDGSADITTVNGEKQQVAAGTAMAIQQDGTVAKQSTVTVLQPKPNLRIVNQDGLPIPVVFSWATADFSAHEYVRIEMARDSKFSRLAGSFDVHNAATRIVELRPGAYYWRVYSIGGEGDTSGVSRAGAASGKITIVDVPVLTSVSPVAGKVFTYRANPPSIRFSWDPSSSAAEEFSYQLLIADNPGMNRPVYSNTVQGSSLLYSGLEEGTWYWQVRPVFPPGYEAEGSLGGSAGATARPVSFKVEKRGSLSAPELLVPENGSPLNIGNENTLFFSWKSTSEADTYTLYIATDRELRNPIIRRSVKNNYVIYNPQENLLKKGEYFWGVSYTDPGNLNSPVSGVRSFTVVQPEPMDNPGLLKAIAALKQAKDAATQKDFTVALALYKNAGEYFGLSEAENGVFIDGIREFFNREDEQAALRIALAAEEAENARIREERLALEQRYGAEQEHWAQQLTDRDAEIARLTQSQQELTQALALARENIARHNADIQTLESQIATLKVEHNTQLQQERRALERQQSAERENWTKERDELKGHSTQLTQTSNARQMRITQLETEIARLTQTSSAQQTRITQMETEIAPLRQERLALERQQSAERENWTKERDELKGHITRLTQTNSTRQARITQMEPEIAKLKQELAKTEPLQSQVAGLNAEVARLTQESNKNREGAAAYQALIAAYTSYSRMPPQFSELEQFLERKESKTAFPGFTARVKIMTDDMIFAAHKEGVVNVMNILEVSLRIQNPETRKKYLENMKLRYPHEPNIRDFIDLLIKRL
ncbi:MAG: hypothetical protein LBT14_05935 [Treponema sp.]|jgi:hypothetical protein|nr:hypothetical protein [Treponema sp.]